MPRLFALPPRPLANAAAALLGIVLLGCSGERAPEGVSAEGSLAVPVEVGPVTRGPLTYRRTVSGSLEAAASFVVAPKVGGRVVSLAVDLGDPVRPGQIVATLDDEELQQAVQQAEADVAVAKASHAEAQSALDIAVRGLKRLESLRQEGVASESQLDAARSEELAGRAHLEVTAATVTRAEASLQVARIRLGYASVTADWSGAGETRVVAERFVDEGGNITPNTPLLSVVQLDPILAAAFVAERDYRLLSIGQRAALTTDAYPGRTFEAHVARIAPVFRSNTRQARVELELANPELLLKPGMFARATLELDHEEDAVSVPFDALCEREGVTGLMVVADDGEHVRWQPVEVGIRDGSRAQVLGAEVRGRVVTLGQELCEDGGRVHVVEPASGS